MDNDHADLPERARPPRFDGPPAGPWHHSGTWVWQPPEARDNGVRSTRRASSWTAAAIVAGVAVTTGYLAHNTPATSTGASMRAGTSTSAGASANASIGKSQTHHRRHLARHHASQSTGTYVPPAPAPVYQAPPPPPVVQPPVVTSGGSGGGGGG